MIVKKSYLFVIASIIIFSCKELQKEVANNDIINSDTLTTKKISLGIQNESNPDFSKMRSDFISLYDSVIDLDFKQGINESDSIFSTINYHCLMDSAIELPDKFVYESSSKFITHNFVAEVLLLKNFDTVYHKTIGKDYFSKILSDELNKYATIISPDKYTMEYDVGTNNMVYNFNISIPVTDIGAGVNLYVNLNGEDSISSVY